ncbi:MAG: hypothetical protein Q9227_004101 [Pyrenula ochraceoflavens]
MPQWPSMIAGQHSSSYSAPALSTAPTLPTPISAAPYSATPTPVTTSGPTPRRTLTDNDRRRMCKYAEDNPTMKQTEIGGTTVSKVLRNKDKYLHPNDGSQSPIKKAKGKFPDVERALANWALKHQQRGEYLSDAVIKSKAEQFVAHCHIAELQQHFTSNLWLEKFKAKHNIHGSRTSRKRSVDAISGHDSVSVVDSSATSASQTPGLSPISPTALTSSPMSPTQSQESASGEGPDSFFDFGENTRHFHSQSTTSLASAFSSESVQGLSGGATSPTSPYGAESNSGPSSFQPELSAIPMLASNFHRPRSQTFPHLGIEPGAFSDTSISDQITPKMPDRSLSAAILESPIEDEDNKPASINPLETMKRNHSVPDIKSARASSMQPPPPPVPKLESVSPNASPVMSTPTQDDARRALELLKTFFQRQPVGVIDPEDYVTIGKLMEKLKLAHSPDGSLPGGMHPIKEYSDSPRMSKKRSIRSL